MKLTLVFALMIGIILSFADSAPAQSKIIRKNVRKIVRPQIAPVQPPEVVTKEAFPVEPLPPPPEPPTAYEPEMPRENPGVFGWNLNTDLLGSYLMNNNGGIFGIRGNLIFADPWMLGSKIGLAEDALEYKVGLGFVTGKDNSDLSMNSIPFYTAATLYLKEGSLFGLDPFIGAGLNLNLYGTGQKSGGIGGEFYAGILADFGFEFGKTAFTLGYGSNKVEGGPYTEGAYLAVSQPFRL